MIDDCRFGKWNWNLEKSSFGFPNELSLERVVPGLDWRSPSARTTIDFSNSYSWSHSTLPTKTSKVKTFVYQAAAERDQYLAPRLLGFGQMIYNHDISQNLNLAQSYLDSLGGTIGKKPTRELDLKGSLDFDAIDSFLHGVPTGYKKTSFQFRVTSATRCLDHVDGRLSSAVCGRV
jgi:hypothetical protein